MTHHRTSPALALVSITALGLLICGGCETPSPTTPFEQARTAFAAGQWAESIVFSTEAINQHPDDVRGYVLRGRAFRRLGQFEPAITDFTIAIQLNPKNPEFYYLRADAYKDRGDIDLADADDKAGQKLDPSYQRAYLFAPPDGSIELPPVAEELSRTLRDGDRESTDSESAEGLTKQGRWPRHRLSARSAANAGAGMDISSDELFESASADSESGDQPEIKDIYGMPVATELNRPTGGLFSPDSIRPGASAIETGRFRARQSGRPSALRGPGRADGDRPGLAETENDPRAAEQGRQRGSGNAPPEYYPPQRSLHPFGAAAMRPTGVPSESADEEFVGDESASDGGRGQGGGGGGYSGSQYGPSNATGGRGYGGPIDPYGGYTRSARPIGGIVGNPYGGAASPYGPGGAQGAAGRRRGPAPRDGDAGSGAAPPNPFGPYQPAPVPYIDPAGLRYD